MLSVRADDIRVLAQTPGEHYVLALVDGLLQVLPAAEASPESVVYTKTALLEEAGVDLTDAEADTLAAGLTARLATA
jgi:hypothetical protein